MGEQVRTVQGAEHLASHREGDAFGESDRSVLFSTHTPVLSDLVAQRRDCFSIAETLEQSDKRLGGFLRDTEDVAHIFSVDFATGVVGLQEPLQPGQDRSIEELLVVPIRAVLSLLHDVQCLATRPGLQAGLARRQMIPQGVLRILLAVWLIEEGVQILLHSLTQEGDSHADQVPVGLADAIIERNFQRFAPELGEILVAGQRVHEFLRGIRHARELGGVGIVLEHVDEPVAQAAGGLVVYPDQLGESFGQRLGFLLISRIGARWNFLCGVFRFLLDRCSGDFARSLRCLFRRLFLRVFNGLPGDAGEHALDVGFQPLRSGCCLVLSGRQTFIDRGEVRTCGSSGGNSRVFPDVTDRRIQFLGCLAQFLAAVVVVDVLP